MIALVMFGEIWENETGSRYCSYRYAIGVPLRSVIVVTSGNSALARSEEMLSTESDSWLDASPSPIETGAITPASNTPANAHRPRNLSRPPGTRTDPEYRSPGVPCVVQVPGCPLAVPDLSRAGYRKPDNGSISRCWQWNRVPLSSVNVLRQEMWMGQSGGRPRRSPLGGGESGSGRR